MLVKGGVRTISLFGLFSSPGSLFFSSISSLLANVVFITRVYCVVVILSRFLKVWSKETFLIKAMAIRPGPDEWPLSLMKLVWSGMVSDEVWRKFGQPGSLSLGCGVILWRFKRVASRMKSIDYCVACELDCRKLVFSSLDVIVACVSLAV